MEIKLDDKMTTEQLVTLFEVLIELAQMGETVADFKKACQDMVETRKILDKIIIDKKMDVTAEAYQEAARLLKENL